MTPLRYVPVLRTRGAEVSAARVCQHPSTGAIPYLDVQWLEKDPPRDAAHLHGALRKQVQPFADPLFRQWACLVDVNNLVRHMPEVGTELLAHAAHMLKLAPVIWPDWEPKTIDRAFALGEAGGACIRLASGPFLSSRITACLRGHAKSLTDLFIDLGRRVVVADELEDVAREALAQVPDVCDWRSVILHAWSRPDEIKSIQPYKIEKVERTNLVVWRRLAGDGPRALVFSDGANRPWRDSPAVKVPPENWTPAIWWAHGDYWLVAKGRPLGAPAPGKTKKDGPDPDNDEELQFARLAKLMAGAPELSSSYRAEHCSGCQRLRIAAGGHGGRWKDWAHASITHHVTHTIEQLAPPVAQ